MLLTIHGLPYSTKYQDLKQLIKDKCNISDFILDNLVSEGSNAKKVRIGLTDDGDGKLLMKCLDGIRLGGSLLRIVPVSKNQPVNEVPPLDRGSAKASTFSNSPQYGNNVQQSDSRPWTGNSNQWQQNALHTNSYNFDAQANVYPAQQGSIAPRPDITQLNLNQRDVFPSRPAIQQDHYKPQAPALHPTRTAALREIQTVDSAPPMYQPSSNQYNPNKPITIKKDNFQGPQSNIDLRGSLQSAAQSNALSWIQPSEQSFPQNIRDRVTGDRGARYSPGGASMNDARRLPPHRQMDDRLMQSQVRAKSPQGRRLSPQNRRMSPPGQKMAPQGHGISTQGLGISPQGLGISPQGRRMSPPGRRISPPGRRISPPGRRISPPGRRISPSGRRISPPGRRISPPGRRISPSGRRLSPQGRLLPVRNSPGRNMEREADRYSPNRRSVSDNPNLRPRFEGPNIRPAAPNQAMYGDGFRSNVHENVQYPVPSARPQVSAWQFGNKPEDDRRANFEPRAISPRKSRSPVRRGRSPVKDRFKRHSPSPRSPRRSWALEKRRSPEVNEAPPPPNWPGTKEDKYPPSKPDAYPGMWDRNKYDEIQSPESDSMRSNMRVQPSRAVSPPRRQMYKPEEPRYDATMQQKVSKHPLVQEERRDFRQPHPMRSNEMEHKMERPDVREMRQDRQDFRQPPKPEQYNRDEEILQRRLNTFKTRDLEQPRFEEKKPLRVTEILDKELEDIYKRTAEFKKKAQVFRNAEEKRKEEERRKDIEFHESLKHNIERDPPRDRSDFRRDDRRFGSDEIQKRSLRRSADRDMDRQGDQLRKPQFEFNKGVVEKEELKSKSIDRRDDRRDQRWGDRRDDNRDLRSSDRPNDRRTDRQDDRRMERKDDRSRVDENRKQDQQSRDKACSELAERILDRRENKNWKSDLRLQVKEALRRSLMNILIDMFKDKEASFIEYTVKFRAYYDANEQDKIFDEVMSNLNARAFKRQAPDVREIQPKALRRDLDQRNVNEDWDIAPANVSLELNTGAMQPLLTQYPVELMHAVNMHPNFVQVVPMPHHEHIPQFIPMEAMQTLPVQTEEINLYLCKDDFECFTEIQLEYLRKFLFCEIERESQNNAGWAPDFSFKPMQSLHRYELKTFDQKTRDWIMQIDFSKFKYFNVLVYTKEELWYERAAVWLPGHSRCKMEPLNKLKLQNRLVEEFNIDKWKLVKKIVTDKGTRVYVDMPPASARALEKHKMMLSYELQKVNVFLKAVAVDKEAFDKGLLGESSLDPAVILNAVKNCPIPTLSNDSKLVKIIIKGSKTMSVGQARKIKEMLLYQVYKYHQKKGKYKTDFIKYGICQPNFFAVLPENEESKRFLLNTSLGSLNRAPVMVVGQDADNAVFFRMRVNIKNPTGVFIPTSLITERLRTSNLGIKGLNVHLWNLVSSASKTPSKVLSVTYDMDLESVEAIMKLNYKLDFADHISNIIVHVNPELGKVKLEEKIKKLKKESSDTYEESNMDISGSDSEDVICLD